jgi:hypothetical protein
MNRRGDLIARVMKVNEEAGMLITSDKFLRSLNEPFQFTNSGFESLNGLLVFFRTPQGHDFWKNISKQLGE